MVGFGAYSNKPPRSKKSREYVVKLHNYKSSIVDPALRISFLINWLITSAVGTQYFESPQLIGYHIFLI